MAGESVTADEAVTMGFVHRVFEDAAFEAEVQAFCRKLAGQPREMLAAASQRIGAGRVDRYAKPDAPSRQIERDELVPARLDERNRVDPPGHLRAGPEPGGRLLRRRGFWTCAAESATSKWQMRGRPIRRQ